MKNDHNTIMQHLDNLLAHDLFPEELSDILQTILDSYVNSQIDEDVCHGKESAREARDAYFHIRRLIDILTLRGDFAVKDNLYPEEPPIRPITDDLLQEMAIRKFDNEPEDFSNNEQIKYCLNPKNSKSKKPILSKT